MNSNGDKNIQEQEYTCPHCQSKLVKMELPPEAAYDAGFFWVCFNDDCPYFVKGWSWMQSQFEVNSSYRYRIDPSNGSVGPLPVWSKSAMKNRIINE